MKNPTSAAHTTFNGDFLEITTQAIGGILYGDPDIPSHYLKPDTDDISLGQTLRNALNASKKVDLQTFQKIWSSGVLDKDENERLLWIMQHYGYKTKRALYKHMRICSVEMGGGLIEIIPSHSDQKGGYKGLSTDGRENIRLPEAASDAELGAALREGFKRCTGAVALD